MPRQVPLPSWRRSSSRVKLDLTDAPKPPPGVTIDDWGVWHFPPLRLPPDPDIVTEKSILDWGARADQAVKEKLAEYKPFMKAFDDWFCAKYPELEAKRQARSLRRAKRKKSRA